MMGATGIARKALALWRFILLMVDEENILADDAPESKDDETSRKPVTPAAQRALVEAVERRKKADAENTPQPKEYDGRGGLDPARYGDWEVKGIISDF